MSSKPGRAPMIKQRLLNIGFGDVVAVERVVAIISPASAPMKRMKDDAKKNQRLVDATHGRKTRSVIIMDSRHVVLSSVQVETISNRYENIAKSE